MDERIRPIVYFYGDVSPTELLEVIGNDFEGDIIVDGYLSDYNDDGTTFIRTHGGTISIFGGISIYHTLDLEGDVYIYDSIDEKSKRYLAKDVEAENDLRIHGSLYAPTKDIDVINLLVGGDAVAKTISALIVIVAGNLEIIQPNGNDFQTEVLTSK